MSRVLGFENVTSMMFLLNQPAVFLSQPASFCRPACNFRFCCLIHPLFHNTWTIVGKFCLQECPVPMSERIFSKNVFFTPACSFLIQPASFCRPACSFLQASLQFFAGQPKVSLCWLFRIRYKTADNTVTKSKEIPPLTRQELSLPR